MKAEPKRMIALKHRFSKFFQIPFLQTQKLSIHPKQKSQKKIIAKISHNLLWRNKDYEPTDAYNISTTVKAACPCVL